MLRTSSFVLAVTVLAAAVPHVASAQSFDDDGPRPVVVQSQDDIEIDGDRARIARRQEIGPAYRGDLRPPAPSVVDDERDPYRRRGYGAYGRDDAYGRPLPRYGRPIYSYGQRPDRPYGPGYAPAAYGVDPTPIGPVPAGAAFGGGPDVGCTIEQTQGVTAAGWRKIVTHRVCYRR